MKNKEIKPQPKNWAKIVKVVESIKKTSNKLIDLSLQNINARLRKNGIIELDNKDLALLAYLPTPRPKNEGLDFFICFFIIVFPNLCQPFLSKKKSKKDTLKSKIEDTAYLAKLSNL